MTQESETVQVAGGLSVPATGGRSLTRLAWDRLRRKRLAMISLAFILAFYLCGIFASVLAPYPYREQNLNNAEQPAWLMGPYCALVTNLVPNYRKPALAPTPDHPLGTDRAGRDMLSRILYGIRTSVIVSLAAVFTGSIFLGVTLGALAGYAGKRTDNIIMRIGEIFLAFPGLLLVILISATVRERVKDWALGVEQATGFSGLVESGFVDYLVVFGALSLFSWVGVARIIRGQILQLREMDYVTAARAIGASTSHIIRQHLLTNTLNIIIYLLSISLAGAIGSELILSWLGIGIQPPTPSLGVMIWETQGTTAFQDQISCIKPPTFVAPISIVFFMTLAFAIFGDGLIDALNPRSRDRVSQAQQQVFK